MNLLTAIIRYAPVVIATCAFGGVSWDRASRRICRRRWRLALLLDYSYQLTITCSLGYGIHPYSSPSHMTWPGTAWDGIKSVVQFLSYPFGKEVNE